MEKVFMVFSKAESLDGSLQEPVAAFRTFEEAEKFASFSVFNGTYQNCMIGTYDVKEKNDVIPPKRVILDGTLVMSNGELDNVNVMHVRPFKEGEDVADRILYVKPTPSFDGDGILIYDWEAIEDINPDMDVFTFIKHRISKKLKEKVKELNPNY